MRRVLFVISLGILPLGAAIAAQTVDPKSAGARGLTEVQGIKVGSFTLSERPTGCTVILVDGEGVPGGVSQRGAAPATAETDLLDPLNMVDRQSQRSRVVRRKCVRTRGTVRGDALSRGTEDRMEGADRRRADRSASIIV